MAIFFRVCMGSLRNHTGITKESNCNLIGILKGFHYYMDTMTVG